MLFVFTVTVNQTQQWRKNLRKRILFSVFTNLFDSVL